MSETVAAQAEVGCWRDGKLVCAHKKAEWPDRCVVCNAPANGYRLKLGFVYNDPGDDLLVSNPFIAVLASVVRREARPVRLGLCARHRASRWRGILLGFVGTPAIMGVGLWFADLASKANQSVADEIFICALLSPVAVVLTAVLMARVAGLVEMDRTFNRLKCGRRFVESLPELPAESAAQADREMMR